MPKEIKGIIVSRLFVLITILTLPIVIFLIYNVADFTLWYSDDPEWTTIIIKILCPTIFSISWLLFLLLFANRLAETLESMDKTIRVVPMRLKFFFGVNALVILFIFVFPAITPFVSALIFMSLAWRLTTFRKQDWSDSKTSFGTKFLMGVFSILPIFCGVSVLPNYFTLAAFLWQSLWLPLLDWVLVISYCLSTSLAIGSLFVLRANSYVSEYEQLYEFPEDNKTMTHIKVVEVIFFIFLLTLAYYKFNVVSLFYNLGFLILLIVYMVNFFSGKLKNKSFKGYLLGYILAGVFMGSNFLFSTNLINLEFSKMLQVWSLAISALLFIVVFFYTFIRMDESSF